MQIRKLRLRIIGNATSVGMGKLERGTRDGDYEKYIR
jgi:hypothetical protein